MRPPIPLTLAALALTMSACGALGGSGGASSSAPPPPPATGGPATAPASAPPSPATSAPASGQPSPADPSASPGTDQLGQPVASRSSVNFGHPVALQIYPVQRDGTVSHVNLTMQAKDKSDYSIAQLLSDGNSDAGDHGAYAADGLQLIEGLHAKVYLVASDGRGNCLCSTGLNSALLSLDSPYVVSATFAAPPADVTAVDVRIPAFGTIKNVPVQ